jgi:hypothetical protein
MTKIFVLILVIFNFISTLECDAQLQFIKNIDTKKAFFDDNFNRIYVGELPVFSLSVSDIVIHESENGIKSFDNWSVLNKEKTKPQINITEHSENILHFEIVMRIDTFIDIEDLFLRLKFLPQNQDSWIKCRKDFHWIPNIKSGPSHIASDHVFRSPVTIMMSDSVGAALIPDLDLLTENRPAPYYMDMRFKENQAPEIIYGISNYQVEPHQYYSKSKETFYVKKGKLNFGFYLILGQKCSKNELLRLSNRFLWEKFGSKYLVHHEPQTVPFKKYAEYGYDMALQKLWVKAHYPNSGGITLSTYFDKETQNWGGRSFPNDLWFHSWFNNMRTAYGLYQWGKKLSKPQWKKKAVEVKNLILNAPTEKGFFKTLYNTPEKSWIASGQGGGRNVYHLPDNSWTVYWLLRFNEECEQDDKTTEFILNYANALLSCQQSDGSFPTRIFVEDLRADSVLNGSASEGLSVWLLAEMRLRNIFPEESCRIVDEAIRKGLDHINKKILPKQKFEDFELYFSCSKKPLDFYDSISEMYGQNTLSIQWCAEAFRAGYQLFKRQQDYNNAMFCIDLLCLYQQVWDPPYLRFYAFGGFGVMNTDAEWNDARQAQFAVTLANFYDLTRNREYMERAIAAAKASFTLMVVDENKNVAPLNYKGTYRNYEIHGAMAENYGHCGHDCRSYQSGFHWGTGSALCTSIILQNRYGDIFIDFNHKDAFGINGIVVNSADFMGNKAILTIDNMTNDEYFGKISPKNKQEDFHLNINNKDVIITHHGFFKINTD